MDTWFHLWAAKVRTTFLHCLLRLRPALFTQCPPYCVRDHAVVAEGPPLQDCEPGRVSDGRSRHESEPILRSSAEYDWALKDNQTVDEGLLPERTRKSGPAFDEERWDACRRQMFQSS